jgi:endo-1,4-beta-D-glucanase Y
VLSDFESGKGTLFQVPSSSTTGFWYSYKDTACSGAQVPVAVTDAAVVAADVSGAGGPHNAGSTCNKYAMHSSISGCQTYSGFGAALHPVLGGNVRNPVDVSTYDGISFWIKAGSGTQGPLYLEFNSKECVPVAAGGVAVSPVIDANNCHGKLLTSIPTTWTQMFVPFGTTGARWLPTFGSGTNVCASGNFCEAPALNPANMLSFQFALEDPFDQKPALASSYDVWVDDVAFYKFSDTPKDAGLKTWSQTGAANTFPQDKTFTGCTKPTGATGKLIQDAYVNWKAKFVVADGSNFKVISPEIDTGSPTVSEGMGYGMLMAVYMGDKALFDGLLGYWKAHGSGQNMLMTWKIGGTGGTGSATDADEDTAFALQMAVKQWGSSYSSDASAILGQFLANDVDSAGYLKPGNLFGGQTLTNPSYFAPAFYRYFASVDTANASKWNALVANCYTELGNISGSKGLVPAWCTGSASSPCSTPGSGGKNYADELTYQYDSHRTPWRIGLDVCWNGASAASAGKSYLDKVVGFFADASNTAGISSLADIYSTTGTPTGAGGGTIVYNSMSLVGCAGAGAMGSTATNAASFRDRVWKFLLAAQYSDNPTFKVGDSATKPGYTYYNATVGLLTLMTLSGNFYPM